MITSRSQLLFEKCCKTFLPDHAGIPKPLLSIGDTRGVERGQNASKSHRSEWIKGDSEWCPAKNSFPPNGLIRESPRRGLAPGATSPIPTREIPLVANQDRILPAGRAVLCTSMVFAVCDNPKVRQTLNPSPRGSPAATYPQGFEEGETSSEVYAA